MGKAKCRIGVVAPASRMSPEVAEKVQTLAGSLYPDGTPEIFFHPQCFASHGHFAGDDETRAQAFLDIANDESYHAVWCARGGYGSCRVVEAVMNRLTSVDYPDLELRLGAVATIQTAAIANVILGMLERAAADADPKG